MNEYQKLLSLCDGLLELQHAEGSEEQKERVSKLCGQLLDGIKSAGITIQEAAAALGLSDETLYRWKKVGKGPKPVYVRQLRDIISGKMAGSQNTTDLSVRIGVPPFWDTALIRTWETALRSHGLIPKFVSVSHMLQELHSAFRDGEIDLALHNGFLIQHDQSLEKVGCSLGLRLQYPLYQFSGYFIYTRRDYVQKKLQAAIAKGMTTVQDTYEKLKEGQWDEVEARDRTEVLCHLLKDAHVGVERGTGMERACRVAYESVSLVFGVDSFVNLRNDQLYECPINDVGNDPDLADASQAFDAFVDGSVDIFCGGLAHHYYLGQQNEERSPEKHSDRNVARRAADKETYILLFDPGHLNVSAVNGIVTRGNQHAAVVAIIGDVWHAGIEQFQHWYADAKGKDEATKSLAIIQLSAMMRVVETQTSIGTYTPHGARIAPADITQTAKWPVWIDNWKRDHAQAPEASADEIREELLLFALKAIDVYRQDWRLRVWQWATLIISHCQFFGTRAEGEAAYARSLGSKKIGQMDETVAGPVVRGASYIPGQDVGLNSVEVWPVSDRRSKHR